MRITAATLRKLADYAAEVSDGRVHLGAIAPGPRYVDGDDTTRVFEGRTATREAALYYGFAAHEFAVAAGTYPPAWVDETLLELLDSPTGVTRAGDAGLDHAAALLARATLTLVAAA
jgi:hypothetical protein